MPGVFRKPTRIPYRKRRRWVGAITLADGAGAASISWSPAGVGSSLADGVGATTVDWSLSGAGSSLFDGAGASTVTWSPAGVGSSLADGAGTATVTWSLAGVGASQADGAGTGTITWSVAGVGSTDNVVDGAGSAGLSWSVAGVGSSLADVAGACSWAWVPAGVGSSLWSGAGSATIVFTATGAGSTGGATNADGAGACSWAWVVTAESAGMTPPATWEDMYVRAARHDWVSDAGAKLGRTWRVKYKATDLPKNLTGWKARVQIRSDFRGTDAGTNAATIYATFGMEAGESGIDIPDPTDGKIVLEAQSSFLALVPAGVRVVYDLTVYQSGGNDVRLVYGTFLRRQFSTLDP